MLLLVGLSLPGLNSEAFAQTTVTSLSFDTELEAALPPPWTLAQLTRAADVIAEVQITTLAVPDPQYGWRESHVTVEHWLKKPDELNGSDLYLWWRGDRLSDLPPSYQVGARYLVFLNHTAMWGSDSPWNHRYRLHLTGGIVNHRDPSLFQLANGYVGDAGLSQYKGWSLLRFEAAVRSILTQPPISASDPEPNGLAALIRYVDIVADVDIVYQDAGVGQFFSALSARQWFKQPDDMKVDDEIDTVHGSDPIDPTHQSVIEMAEDSDHRIVFALDWPGRAKQAIAVYGIRNGYVDLESFVRYVPDVPRPHSYLGWSADRFYAAIRAAQKLADSPATLLPQSGQSSPASADWLLVGLLALIFGLVIRKRAMSYRHVQT